MTLEEFIDWYRSFNENEPVDMHEVYTLYFYQEQYIEQYYSI